MTRLLPEVSETATVDESARINLRQQTYESAIDLFDDLDFLERLSTNPAPSPSEIRRTTAILRRMLVDRIIPRVADPRIGRIEFHALNNKPFIAANRTMPFSFFGLAGANVFGVRVQALVVDRERGRSLPENYNPDEVIKLRFDSFIKQEILCFEGKWIRRGEIIEYMANVAGGVHSGHVKNDKEALIRRARHAFKLKNENNLVQLNMNRDAFHLINMPIIYNNSEIDCIMIEVLATIQNIISSESVIVLREYIRDEISRES